MLDALASQQDRHFLVISRRTAGGTKRGQKLRKCATKAMEILPGQHIFGTPRMVSARGKLTGAADWESGNLTSHAAEGWYDIWLAGQDPAKPEAEQRGVWTGPDLEWGKLERAWRMDPHLRPDEHCQLRPAARRYWSRRQDGFLASASHTDTVAACDGSAGAEMGAAAVFYSAAEDNTEWPFLSCKVGGDSSSFRAEAAAMYLALSGADPDTQLTVLTDSMNVIQALQAWNHEEYFRDMSRQKNADIITSILTLINKRTAPLRIVKVKSHMGCELNERADAEAGSAAAADPRDIDTRFPAEGEDSCFTFSWWEPGPLGEETVTTKIKAAHKQWQLTSLEQAEEKAVLKPSMAVDFLLQPAFHLHLLQRSKRLRKWTTQEQRRWMQMVSRTFPTNTYLQRIGKHKTGCCPWCPKVRETQTHFQCNCPQFAKNRIAAHHAIARAVMAALIDIQPPQWQFKYETQFSELPFTFKWATPEEEEQERGRRPDGVAYNPGKGILLFLEFTRAFDHIHNMAEATTRKKRQYRAAEIAARRAETNYTTVDTIPLIFGVRGAVLANECGDLFKQLGLTWAQQQDVLAAGVRAAITGASDLCSARLSAPKPPQPKTK